MSRRALRAGLCALAAVAFLLAAFLPWFESRRGEDDRDGPRASYQLQGGERCEEGRCKDLSYTGAPGLRDDAFAVFGWVTLAGSLGTMSLVLAAAAVRRRHPTLRAWTAVSAAVTAATAAMFVAGETISRGDDLARGWGLAAITAGAIVAGVALALPAAAAGERRPERRWALMVALAGGACVAWLSLTDHGWWRGVGAFRAIAASPLGREICDGDDCQSGALAAQGNGFLMLTWLVSALTAALLVPAIGAATRCAQGRAPGAWAIAAAVLALAALACGAGVVALHPHGGSQGIAWGLPGFAGAMLVVAGASLVARSWITAADVEDEPVAAAPGPRIGLRGAASGPRPVLPALAPPAAVLPPLAPHAQQLAPLGAQQQLAPRGAQQQLAAHAQSLAPLAPPTTSEAPPPYDLELTIPDAPAQVANLPDAHAAGVAAVRAATVPDTIVSGPPAMAIAPATLVSTPPPVPVPAAAPAPATPWPAPTTSMPPAPAVLATGASMPMASMGSTPVAPMRGTPVASMGSTPVAPMGSTPVPSPYSPWQRPGGAPHAAGSPAWANADRDDFVPPRPGAREAAVRPPVASPAPLAPRSSPRCPGCKQATLWHGKRGSWWCTACKRAL